MKNSRVFVGFDEVVVAGLTHPLTEALCAFPISEAMPVALAFIENHIVTEAELVCLKDIANWKKPVTLADRDASNEKTYNDADGEAENVRARTVDGITRALVAVCSNKRTQLLR